VLFVQDHAQVFSVRTVAGVERRIAATRAATGEELVVVTVPRLAGARASGVVEGEAERLFYQEGVRGTLLYVDRNDRRDAVIAQPAAWFDARRVAAIRRALEARFQRGEYDAGLRAVAGDVLAVYDAHAATSRAGVRKAAPRLRIYAWIAAALLAYLVIRGALRRAGA
jgi:uncharacterized membrane protein YgcG